MLDKLLSKIKLITGLVQTLIPRLGSRRAFEAALKLQFGPSIEVHYMEKNHGMFSSKTLISFRLKKDMKILDDVRGGE